MSKQITIYIALYVSMRVITNRKFLARVKQ